jgi:hypothetical protein
MNLTVQIADDLAQRLSAAGGDLSRRALEAFALEEFRSGNLTKPELRQLLGYETRASLDGFLKAHGVFEEYTLDDLEQERRDLSRLGPTLDWSQCPAVESVPGRLSGAWVSAGVRKPRSWSHRGRDHGLVSHLEGAGSRGSGICRPERSGSCVHAGCSSCLTCPVVQIRQAGQAQFYARLIRTYRNV